MNEFENIEMIEETEDMNPEFDTVEVDTEESGLGKMAILAIGAIGTAAIGAAVAIGKKLWNKHKAKTALRQPDEEEPVEVTEEMIEEVTEA